MKHGPIALISQEMPVVVIAPTGCTVYDKVVNNIQEIKARKGKVIAIVTEGDKRYANWPIISSASPKQKNACTLSST